MGKKGTKRKTRWRALPLGEDDAGSGNEEEYLDEDQSTTSSVVSHATNVKIHTPVFRMGEKPYRTHRRFPYDRFRGKEPLIKLESKTFDEDVSPASRLLASSVPLKERHTSSTRSNTDRKKEYTKITTPRQDVLFKKGCFGRKRESSVEETAPSVGEVEGEEPMMDQYIITNGFLDERGHYYVNGSSYEVYDPYSNTVTVVVGPPPYTNGVNQPVLAAVSCQPVPLTPVEWYPPSSEWPSHGSAWTPSYPHGEQNGDASSAFNGHDGQIPSLYQRPAYIVPSYVYSENPNFNGDGTSFHNNPISIAEAPCSNDVESNADTQRLGEKSKELGEEENDKVKELSLIEPDASQNVIPDPHDAICNNVDSTANAPSNQEPLTAEQERVEVNTLTEERESPKPFEKRYIEKQSHSTQTNSSEPENFTRTEVKVKQSHSTQTVPEVFENMKTTENEDEVILLPSHLKNDQGSKPLTKNKEPLRTAPRHNQDERKLYQRKMEEKNSKPDARPSENNEVESKISYAKKLLNGLENKEGKKTSNSLNGVKMPSDCTNAQTNVVAQAESHSSNPANKTNFSGKRLNNDKFIPAENKRNNARLANGTIRTANERQRQNKSNVKTVNKVNVQFNRYKDKKVISKVYDKTSEPVVEGIAGNVANETIVNETRSQSEKSSSVSELSSPTDLSSGQNTPPEKLIVRKMEQKIANDLNRSFQEKLKQNLKKNDEDDKQEEVAQEQTLEDEAAEEEVTEELEEEQITKRRQRDKKRNKGKKTVELALKEKPKANRSKKKKKVLEEKAESEDSPDENLFFHLYGKSQDFLNKTWESMNKEKVEPIPDLGSILATENDDILETLGIVEKLKIPKLPLSSDLLLFPGFGRERPKQKFEDFFTSAALKQLQDDMFTKTNITNMRSTKPEEFFASVVENPTKELKKNEKKDNSKNGRKGTKTTEAEVLIKKYLPKVNSKVNKGLKCKEDKTDTNSDDKKNGLAHEEAKLGIVEAVNNWLQEQDDAEKFLSVENIKVSTERREDEEKECNQKNVQSNPIHALLVEEEPKCQGELTKESACIRVANTSRDDGYVATETAAKKERKFTRLYRSSSWDAKLSEVQIKKHFKFLTEASSWDRRKLKDAALRKHFKFIADSARVCKDLFRDVRNGYEFAREELCDPKQSVSKYYTLSPSVLDSFDKSFDCENEVFDALEYKFLSKDDRRNVDLTGNLPITDSGIHSDMESNEEATTHATSLVKYSLPNEEVCCKMQ